MPPRGAKNKNAIPRRAAISANAPRMMLPTRLTIAHLDMPVTLHASPDVGTPGHTGRMPAVAELFAFENRHPRHTSRKEALIVDELGLSPARYYQILVHAVASEEGVRLDPLLCGRIRRRTSTRHSAA